MPLLLNPRHEAFARARARGAMLDDAYEMAGYAPARGHSSRLAGRPDVAERIGELRGVATDSDAGCTQAVVESLIRMADRFDAFDTPERMRETRQTIMEARNLQREMIQERAHERLSVLSVRERRLRRARANRKPAKTCQDSEASS